MADPWAPVSSAPLVAAPKPPPTADGWTPVSGQAWAAVSSAPAQAAAPATRKPGRLDTAATQKQARDYWGEVYDRDLEQPWRRVAEDLAPHPEEGYLQGLKRSLRGPLDLAGAVGSTAGAAYDALIAKPGSQLAAKVPAYRVEGGKGTAHLVRRDPQDVAEEARGALNTAGMAVRPGGKLNKMPDFGPAWAPLPPKIRAPKEPLFADPAGQFRPSEPKPPGPIYGGEPKRAERLDNALHRVAGHETADRLEALRSRQAIRKELGEHDQAEGERLTRELEQALVDPNRKLSPEAEQALSRGNTRRYRKEQTEDMNAIRKLAAKNSLPPEAYLEDQGHVPRRVEGLAPAFDTGLVDHRDPITGRGQGRVALNKSTSALRSRAQWRMLQPKGKGEPLWVSAKDVEANPGRYELGATITGSGGKRYTVRQPTIDEIEANTAGTDHETRYHKNYYDLIHDDRVRVRQVRRNLETLDAALTDLKGRGLAHRIKWMRPETTADGRTIFTPTKARTPAPEGFVQLHHVPQLEGWAFAPEIAEVFKDYKPAPGEDAEHLLTKINNTLTSTLFWNPLPHEWNVANDWAKARGWDWLPGRGGYSSLLRNGSTAVQAVITKNELYRNLLREGASLMSGDQETRNFQELMLRKGVMDLKRDRTTMSTLMHALDLKGVTPQKLVASIYKAASSALWKGSDILMVQRILELQDRGMPVRQAIAQAEKDIASYRVPSRVLGSRATSELLRNPNVSLFGRYHYSMVKSWGHMFRDLYAGSPAERTEAAGKFLAAMILAQGAYPLLDHVAQRVTGNAEARVHRGGSLGLSDAVSQLTKDQKDWASTVARFLDIPPATKALVEGVTNHAFPFGQQIVDPAARPVEQAAEAGEHAATYVNPLQQAMQAAQPGGLGHAAARNLLVDAPTQKAGRGKRYGQRKDKRAIERQRRTDPFVRAAGDFFQ